MAEQDYRSLAQALDQLPHGFPPAPDGSDLRLLEYLFSPEEAALAACLRPTLENPRLIAERAGMEVKTATDMLKSLAQRGLIQFGRGPQGAGFALEPFVVGFYENQSSVIDEGLARLVEDYFRSVFFKAQGGVQPQFHRVVPVFESLDSALEIAPYESVVAIINQAKSWGVQDCICRKQKALIGEPCDYPLQVCLAMAPVEGAFDRAPHFRALSREEALAVLREAAQASLVHSVSNTQEGNRYICNCCPCCCGNLRGMTEFGIANVMASSAFVNTVDETACTACGVCVELCPFRALSLADTAVVDTRRCTGCGVCVAKCPTQALALVRRPEEEIKPVPRTAEEWAAARLDARKGG